MADGIRRFGLRGPRGVRLVGLIDAADAGVLAHSWYAKCGPHDRTHYVYRVITKRRDRPRRIVLLHRELLGLEAEDRREGDHINGNGLDNRRANLRIVTHAQNGQNRRRNRNNRSGRRGVSWDHRAGRWRADINIGARRVFLGYFVAVNEAAARVVQARSDLMPYATN